MTDDEVIFFEQVNYGGPQTIYPVEYGLRFDDPEYINDRFKSVKIGKNARVLTWQDRDASGKYEEWVDDNPDISSSGALSRFEVIPSSTLAVTIRFEDRTDASKVHSLLIYSSEVGGVELCAGELEFKLVGILSSNGPPTTAFIYTKVRSTDEYHDTGYIDFEWNNITSQIDIVDTSQFPANCSCKRNSANQFIFYLDPQS